MTRFLIIILTLTINSALCQVEIRESFSYLTTLNIDSTNEIYPTVIKYNQNLSSLHNERLKIPYEFLEDNNYVVGQSSIKLIETKLDSDVDKKYFITFGPIDGPEIGFTIFEVEPSYKIIGQIYSRQLIVPGNGFLYSVERDNLNFFVKKKYKIVGQSIEETKQPYYSVNLDSYALTDITIYSDESLTNPLAKIPKNGRVKVLVTKDLHEYDAIYLVQTSFGLVGWTKIIAGQYQSKEVQGIFYYGD